MDGASVYLSLWSPAKSMSRMVVIMLQVFAGRASGVRKRVRDLVAEKGAVRYGRQTRE